VNDSGSLAAFTYTDELSEYFFPFAEESLPDSFCRNSKNASWVLAFQLSIVRFSGHGKSVSLYDILQQCI
jgi:sugar lactone lactonase YvrE